MSSHQTGPKKVLNPIALSHVIYISLTYSKHTVAHNPVIASVKVAGSFNHTHENKSEVVLNSRRWPANMDTLQRLRIRICTCVWP